MKTRFTIGVAITIVVLIGLALGLWWKFQPEPNVNIYEPMGCLYSDTITSTTAVPDWTTQTKLEARSIDTEKFSPYTPLEDLTLDDQPLAWETTSGKVVVDNEIFSDLQFVDVTGFTGELVPFVIGQLTETDLKDDEWRTVLEFLLKSHVIKTYAHLEAEVCLAEEVNSDTEYSAYFSAVHRYCTSDCYEVPYAFTVKVNKQTGNISIQ